MELLFLTSYYPYNFGDTTFIKPEIPFLSKAFNKVHVMNMLIESLQYKKIDVPANFNIVDPNYYLYKLSDKKKRITSVFFSFFHIFKLAIIFFYELCYLIKNKKININVLKTFITFLLNANILAIIIKKHLQQNPDIKIIYTYWYKYETLAAIICKKYFNLPVKCITRAHGGDLYEFVQENNYQPYKKWMDKYIDRIFFASKAGYNYYLNLFSRTNKEKYILSKLGIENPYQLKEKNNTPVNDCLNIISCSYMVPNKRIHLIIKALSEINDINIKWTHIGDGIEKNNLENSAYNLLKNKTNITYNFIGFLDNDSIKKYYNDNFFDCFVSTTITEGGNPVSMMEAISFGIPIIASNVGGVPEIVNNKTGILLDPDNCADELVKALHHFAAMTVLQIETLRKSCRKYWEENYMAENQYPLFIENVLNLLN